MAIAIESQVSDFSAASTAGTFRLSARTGKLRRAWRGVKVPGHVDDVLAFVQSL